VVAPGYYLYRDKMRFEIEGARLAAQPVLPRGEVKNDEFFGRTETLRGEVAARLALEQPAAAATLTVVAESQGCADVGVCYPPQRQKVAVVVPKTGAKPGAFVEAVPPKRRWFQ
jgi:thiol:disulfide interchange protein DsbD